VRHRRIVFGAEFFCRSFRRVDVVMPFLYVVFGSDLYADSFSSPVASTMIILLLYPSFSLDFRCCVFPFAQVIS